MKKLLCLVVLVGLTACGGIFARPTTIDQKFYQAVADYEVAQDLAKGFIKVCHDQGVPKNCKLYVTVIQTINSKANSVIQAAKSNQDVPNYLEAATTLVKQFADNLKSQVKLAEGTTATPVVVPDVPTETPTPSPGLAVPN